MTTLAGGLFFLSLLGWAALWMLLMPRLKLGDALLGGLCGMLFVSYVGVILLQWMKPAAWLVMLGGLAAFVVGLVFACVGRRGLRERLLSPALGIYLAVAALFVVVSRGHIVQDHDAYSFWSRCVRELYTFDTFYIHGASTMFHMDYIPLLASLQYCVARVFGWQDVYLVYVTFACALVSVCALGERLRPRWLAPIAALLFLYAYYVFGFSLYNIRADGPMLMIFVSALLCLLFREDDSTASLVAPLCAAVVLAGFKIYTGLMFSFVLIAALLTEALRAKRRRRPARTLAVCALLALIGALFMHFSWSVLYHYSSAMASYEAAAARAAYLGEAAADAAAPSISLSYLFSGNPRTSRLASALSPESLEKVGGLIGETFQAYAQSALVWVWPFVLLAILLAVRSGKENRGRGIRALIFLLAAGAIYLLGLFGSYFVQSETAGAAVSYLSTATAPLLIASVFIALYRFSDGPLPKAALALMTAGMLLLLSPASYLESWLPDTEYGAAAVMATEFYSDELEGLLAEEDAGKRALLIDCSYAASEIRSSSGKTHTYAYWGLPLRVEVLQLPFEDYSLLDDITTEYLVSYLKSNRTELLLLRVEDMLYADAIQEALDLEDGSFGVYEVSCSDGEFSFSLR